MRLLSYKFLLLSRGPFVYKIQITRRVHSHLAALIPLRSTKLLGKVQSERATPTHTCVAEVPNEPDRRLVRNRR